MQAGPSGSQEENDKIEGEINASWDNTTPATSSRAPTEMDVDPTPASTSPQLEEEEKEIEEIMAHEGVIPPDVSQEPEKEEVVTNASEEVVVPPTDENAPKEKAIVPEPRKLLKEFQRAKLIIR